MPEDAMAIFAGKSVDTTQADGGTQSWIIDPKRARRCRYVVLCRNTNPDYPPEYNVPHGSAFMVGKIANVVRPTPDPRAAAEGRDHRWPDEERWKILFSEFAHVSIPNVWGGWRNPVKYTSMAELGIDPDSLDFHPMPELPPVEEVEEHNAPATPTQNAPLTIAEAKMALAATYGVAPEAIEITIRG